MYENATIAKLLNDLAVRITTTDNLEGSGILFVPNSIDDKIYIITAKHCLKGKDNEFTPGAEEITVHLCGGELPYHVSVQERVMYHESEDLALIIVSKTDIESIHGTVPKIPLVADNGGELQTMFYGFPKCFSGRGPVRVNTRLLPPIAEDVFWAESNLESEQNLTAFTVEGFSGSGLCLLCSGNIYLLGIVTNFDEWRRFGSVNINKLNELLNGASLRQEKVIVLETNPLLIEGCEILENNSRNILESIGNKISEIAIERKNLMADAKSLLNKNDVVFISGIAGVGKSTFSKMLIADLVINENYKAVCFNGAQICRNGSTELLTSLKITTSFDQLLKSKELLGKKILYIDSGEKAFESNQTEILKEVLQLPLKYPGLKVAISIREYALSLTTFAVTDVLNVKNDRLKIELLSDEELVPVIAKHPKIKDLIANQKIEPFVRTPFYLKQIIEIQDNLDAASVNEGELKKQLWERLIRKDNLNREELFQSIAVSRAQQLSPYIMLSGNPDHGSLQQLLSENLIISSVDDFGIVKYAPSHDIFEDWALVRYVAGLYSQSSENLESCFNAAGDSYAVKRGFRFWLQELFRIDATKAQRISQELLEHPDIEENWKNESITALLNSSVCYQFLSANKALLLKDKARLLKRAVHLLRTTCKVWNDKQREPTYHDDKAFATSSRLLPSGPGWLGTIRFIDENLESLSDSYFLFSYLLSDWKNDLSAFENPDSKWAVSLTLKLLVLHRPSYKRNRDSPNDPLTKELIKILFRLAGINTVEVTNFLVTSFDFIKEATDSKLSNPSLDYYHLEDFHEKVIEIALSHEGSEQLCRVAPDLMMEIARFEWFAPPLESRSSEATIRSKSIVDMLDTSYSHDENWKYCGLKAATKRAYRQESALQTPVGHILTFFPTKGTEFVIELINKTITSYAEHPKVNKAGLVEQVTIKLNDGGHVTQFGSGAIWEMYRGHTGMPDLLQSILMALENYLLDLAKVNTEESRNLLSEIVAKLYRESKSVGTTAVIASLANAYPFIIGDQMIPLFTSKDAILWDLNRYISERNIFLPVSLDSRDEKFRQERLASKNLPHRQEHLERLIFKMSFYEGFYEPIIDKIDSYKSELANDGEIERKHYHWPNVLFRMDRRNYSVRGYEDEKSRGVILEPVIPEGSKISSDMKMSPSNEGLGVWNWCNQIIEKDDQSDNSITAWRQNFSQCKILKERNNLEHSFYNAPGAISLIGIKYYWKELSEDEKCWCVENILDISNHILDEEKGKHSVPYGLGLSNYQIFDKKPVIEALGLLFSLSLAEPSKSRATELAAQLLLHLPISDGINKPLFEKLAAHLWIYSSTLAQHCFRFFIKIGSEEISEDTDVSTYRVLENKLEGLTQYDFKSDYLNRLYLDKAFILLSACANIDEEGFSFLSAYLGFLVKDTLKKETQTRKWFKERPDYYEGSISFWGKFGILILNHLDEKKAAKLFYELIRFVLVEEEGNLDHLTDKSIELLSRSVRNVILAQDQDKHTERFNNLWSILAYQTYRSGRLVFIKSLLLDIEWNDSSGWRDSATSWDAIDAKPDLYKKLIAGLGEYDQISAAKLISGIGFDSLFPASIGLFLELIQKKEEKGWLLNYNAEKYIQRVFFLHGKTIVSHVMMRGQFISILDAMINAGSSIAFVIKESVSSVGRGHPT